MGTTHIVIDRDPPTAATIQRAVDEMAGTGGGVVEVPAGTYRMENALRLRDGVRVVGEAGTVLEKAPSVASVIVDYLGYGHYELTVAEPEKFRVGMGVHVLDDKAFGFYTTVATIVGIDGERLFIDRMLNHDYAPADHARAVSAYSLVEMEGVSNAGIEGLTLDGNMDEETFTLNGCRGSGVFVLGSRSIEVCGVEVRNYRGDGIGFQQCVDVNVTACGVHHVTGQGLHPGSGTVRYVISGNHVHDNGGCGIFYCLRTTHSRCDRNTIERNGLDGISIGERDSDHLIEGNVIRENGGAGVLFREPMRRSGDRVRLRRNEIAANGKGEGRAEIDIAAGLREVWVESNAIRPESRPVICVGGPVEEVYVVGNTVDGREQRAEDVVGDSGGVRFESPVGFAEVGPEAAPKDGARHLGVGEI
ncbi:MAG: hypothetical protein CMJ49_05880 [Planctomycetaceae bacterium]|nr:hypothetical protein [Planctomycetaceae bacterium]